MDEIDKFYEKKRLDSSREYEKLRKMIQEGALPSEIRRQQEIAIDAGNTGD